MKLKYFNYWLTASILVAILDQSTKYLTKNNWQLNLAGAMSFTWLSTNRIIWLVLTGSILLGLGIYLLKTLELNRKIWPAWALVWGGGLANWLDRVFYGGVRDIWPIYGTNLKNNLADYALTFGIIWLMIDVLWKLTLKPEKNL